MYDCTQLHKGLIEGCILHIISQAPTYGYNIISQLEEKGFENVRESTIYPLLVRLEKRELILSYYEPSLSGPTRKYYQITQSGVSYLNEFVIAWCNIEKNVNNMWAY